MNDVYDEKNKNQELVHQDSYQSDPYSEEGMQ